MKIGELDIGDKFRLAHETVGCTYVVLTNDGNVMAANITLRGWDTLFHPDTEVIIVEEKKNV